MPLACFNIDITLILTLRSFRFVKSGDNGGGGDDHGGNGYGYGDEGGDGGGDGAGGGSEGDCGW